MTHVDLRVSGSHPSSLPSRFRAFLFAGATAGFLLVAASVVLSACSPSTLNLGSPACKAMQAQVKEKQKLDAEVKALAKEARDLRKQGDTTSAAAAERRLEGLVENQRFLKDELDRTSGDCSPGLQDTEPPLDPAVRERQRLEGR